MMWIYIIVIVVAVGLVAWWLMMKKKKDGEGQVPPSEGSGPAQQPPQMQ